MKSWRTVLPACALVGACAPDAPADRATARDSAGISIVETVTPTVEWRLSAEPVLRIGVVDGEDAYQFSSIAFAGRYSDGRIVVADRQSLEIRLFDRDGRHLSTLDSSRRYAITRPFG